MQTAPDFINGLLDLEAHCPERYGWRYHDDESFGRAILKLKTAHEHNVFYWRDQSRNVEAYMCMCVFRSCELLKPAVRSLNVGEIIAPAILARSLLELATTIVQNISVLDNIIRQLSFPPDAVEASQEFEEIVTKMIWGTRLGDPLPHLKQTNVLTSIQKLSKLPQAADLLPTYEYLCEIAHPNVMGNARFWGVLEAPHEDGSVRVTIEKRPAQSAAVREITAKVLWSIGWSCECVCKSFLANRKALELLYSKLGMNGSGAK